MSCPGVCGNDCRAVIDACDFAGTCDCSICGNGICESPLRSYPAPGEDNTSCPADCFCGDGICDPVSENETNCPADCLISAPVCGDHICDPKTENSSNCPQDCPAK
jgi:hypothetical protein